MIRLITLASVAVALCACRPETITQVGGGGGGDLEGGADRIEVVDPSHVTPLPQPKPGAPNPQARLRDIAADISKDSTKGVFVVTNRRPLDLAKKSFTDKRSDALTYGFAYQKVSATATGVKPKPNLSLELAKPDEFFGYVQTRAAEAKVHPKHIVVFVHGFNQKPQQAMSTAVAIKSLLQFDGPFVLFMWPSRGAFLDYGADRLDAENSGESFSDLVCRLKTLAPDTKVTILAHSMGNYLTVNALYGFAQACPNAPKLNALVMFSPDVPVSTLEAKGKKAISSVVSTTAYVSKHDLALGSSSLIWNTGSFGLLRDGLPTVFDGISSIDVSSLQPGFDLKTFGHNSYAYTQVMEDVYDLLSTGRTDPTLRGTRIHRATRPDNNGVFYVMDGATKGF